jgi:hypothetical protein
MVAIMSGLRHTGWYRFFHLSPDARLLVVRAFFFIQFTNAGLRLFGFRRWRALLQSLADCLPTSSKSAPLDEQAQNVARAIRSAALRSPGGATCLERSMVLWYLLRRAGIPAELCIGGRKSEVNFEAHAWVECAGLVFTDSADAIEGYSRFGASA